MNTKWEGLWAQERPAFYAGKVIKKADIPAYTRIVLRYNKFYEKGSNKPKFIYCFSEHKIESIAAFKIIREKERIAEEAARTAGCTGDSCPIPGTEEKA